MSSKDQQIVNTVPSLPADSSASSAYTRPADVDTTSFLGNSFDEISNQERNHVCRNAFNDLCEAIDASSVWKYYSGGPHPIKKHLQTTYDLLPMKDVLSNIYPNLKSLLSRNSLHELPQSVLLLLCSLCAALCGLIGTDKSNEANPWELVAKTWCINNPGDELKDACYSSMEGFMFQKSEQMDEETKKRVLAFWEHCKEFLESSSSTTGNYDVFSTCVSKTFSKEKNLFQDIFVCAKAPKAKQWGVECKAFVYTMLLLCQMGTKKAQGSSSAKA